MRSMTRGAVLATVLSLGASLLLPPAASAAPAGPGAASPRAQVLAAYRTGGGVTARAAEAALLGTDADVHRFLTEQQPVAAEHDARIEVSRMLAASGPAVRAAADAALSGDYAQVRAFLANGWQQPLRNDQRRQVNQLMARGGEQLTKAGQAALNGTDADVEAFLKTGQFVAEDKDNRVRVNKILAAAAEGSAVHTACQRALDGDAEDIREFLRSGWQVAVQRDEEKLTVAGLAELAADAQVRAAAQTDIAKDNADQALAAARKAREAAERAAAETAAAQGDARKAAQAAGRAATAAQGAASAAQTAINAAGRANEAARVAANAAGQAAIAASMTERAAARAQDAAAGAARDKSKAHEARVAAENARAVAKSATEAAAAADAAGRAVAEAGKASEAARGASGHADAAAKAAEDAAAAARRAGASAAEAERAAARARQAAAEAQRAANRTQSLAQQAAQAAFDARDAANSAADHARKAADDALAAADAHEEAEAAARRAATAAVESDKAAQQAKSFTDKAHQVAATARATDEERLKQQESQAIRDAEDAARAEAEAAERQVWQGGRPETFDAETQRLLTEAAKPETAPAEALRQARGAALRLLARGGPWVRSAAETALGGTEAAVRLFVGTGLAQAVEQDDRAGLGIIAADTDRPAQKAAAFAAQTGTHEQVTQFLRTRHYEGKAHDDRKQVNQIMAAAGPDSVVFSAGNEALNADSRGDAEALHRFLETGRHAAAKADNRKQVNKILAEAQRDKLREVAAAAQAALSGPDSHVARFLTEELPNAQLRDADTATHVAQIEGYLAKADQSAALARQNANLAAEHAAIARKAADEAAQWAAKAQQSAAQAKAAADAAKASADAAQRSADQARADALQAGKDAEAAERAAQEALQAAARFSQVSEQRENVGEVPNEKNVSPFGIEKVPENMKDEPTVDPRSARCYGRMGTATCFYKVDHHITGTLRFFTFACPPGATTKQQCQRVEIGTSPIDFHYTTEEKFNTAVMTGQVLLALAKSIIDDFVRCATDTGWGQAEACAWTAAAIIPPARFIKLGELLATSAKITRTTDEFDMFLSDGKSGIKAVIDSSGHMSLVVKKKIELEDVKGIGGKFFTSAMDHFGGRVKAVDGAWFANGDMADNINKFNELLKKGLSMDDAARGTFTGRMSGKYGFTKVEFLGTEGPFAEYTKVFVRFS